MKTKKGVKGKIEEQAKDKGPVGIEIVKIARKLAKIPVKSSMGSTYISHQLTPEQVGGFDCVNRQQGKVVVKKIRNLDDEYKSCFYKTLDGKYGIPTTAFAGCILDAAVAVNIPKTQIKRAVRVLGDVYPLKYSEVRRRVDVVRQSGMTKAPDIRHRPEFVDWSCEILVEYDENQISMEQIANLVNQAGFSTGVGDWRPARGGTHGMFEVSNK